MQTVFKVVALLATVLGISACNSGNANEKQPTQSSVPVNILTIKEGPQSIWVELPGRSRAYMEAEVRPQVSGIIQERSFHEGGYVSEGQSLYQINPAVYEATLISAKAQLQQANAALTAAKATYSRVAKLIKTNAVSQQDYDKAQASYLEAKAQVAVAKAAINTAQINLEYTKVKAPISGQIGKSYITQGSLVTANQSNSLAKISKLDPINIDIVQSSAQLLKLKAKIASGKLKQAETSNVALLLEDNTSYPHLGKLKFSEVTVDENTGSVVMRAEFPNPDGLLLPGMFVRTKINIGIDPNAILVPQKAISRTPRGDAVTMVVNADNKVEMRTITTSDAINNQWLISNGLFAGDKIIVEGLQKVRSGTSVTTTEITNDIQHISKK